MRSIVTLAILAATAVPALASEAVHLTPPLTREHAADIRRAPVMSELATVPRPVHAAAPRDEAAADAGVASFVAEATAR